MEPLDYLNPDLNQFEEDIDNTKGLAQMLPESFFTSLNAYEPMDIEEIIANRTQDIPELPIASVPSNFLNYQFQNARTPFTPVREGITTLRSRLGNLKDKGIDMFDSAKDLGKTAVGGLISLATGIPGADLILDAFQMSPEEKAARDFYAQNYGLTNTGQVASGVMQGYNPVSMFGGPGLLNSIDKRIARISKTLLNKNSLNLRNRLKELKELRQKESQAASDFLESQRRGRRPSAPSGDGGGGVRDSGGPTGGYSYDSGGREGFGYGL